jgi:hypothetical protein
MDGLVDAKWLLATWQLQVALGSGYTAYMIAYTGIRTHHKTIETTFRALAFGLVATSAMLTTPTDRKALTIVMAFGATVIAGLIWRRLGMRAWAWLLRILDISWADDTPSAWIRLNHDQTCHITQISVLTTDGTVHKCDDAERCGQFPMGPCIFGTNGDVLMYVTHRKKPGDETDIPTVGLEDAHWGARATYLPAEKIERIDIRQKPVPQKRPLRKARRWLFSRFQKAEGVADSRS